MKEAYTLNKSEAIAYIACQLMQEMPIEDTGFMANLALDTYKKIKKNTTRTTMAVIRNEIMIMVLLEDI